MKNLIATFILPLTLVLTSWSQAADRLTLEQAIARAREVSDAVHSSLEDVRIAQLQTNQASKLRLPMLDFTGSYIYTSEVMSQSSPATTIPLGLGQSVTIPGRDIVFGDHHNVDFKVQVTQPIFTGFRLQRTWRAARETVKVRQAEAERLSFQVRVQTEQNYLNLQRARAVLEISHVQVQTLERHLEVARHRVREGVALAEFVSRAEYALSQARLNLQQMQQHYDLAKLTLMEQLKLPPETDPELDTLRLISPDTTDKDLSYAQAHRAEFRTLKAQAGAAEHRIQAQRGPLYPALSAFGAVDYGRPGVDMIQNDWMLYERAGATLSWTLWDWGIRKNKVQEVQAARRQLEDANNLFESQVRLQIAAAKLALNTGQQRLEVTAQGQRLAADILHWVENRYREGVATEDEYQDAQSELLNSQINAIVALADYRLAQVALIAALGGE
jgi:outer membrane protein